LPDTYRPKERSRIMSRIRSTGNRPERQLYEIARSVLGWRWRIDRNVRSLPGRPDLLIPALRLAIFADGCFYHCCPKHWRAPKSNSSYWIPKLRRNTARDRANERTLRRRGFSVWRVWEHDLRVSRTKSTYSRLRRRFQSKGVRTNVISAQLLLMPRRKSSEVNGASRVSRTPYDE
jgi:DNA mismatch endonuclease (patch repair protein)